MNEGAAQPEIRFFHKTLPKRSPMERGCIKEDALFLGSVKLGGSAGMSPTPPTVMWKKGGMRSAEITRLGLQTQGKV